jgi:hypothetical protein
MANIIIGHHFILIFSIPESTRLELATPAVTGRCSDQLSYGSRMCGDTVTLRGPKFGRLLYYYYTTTAKWHTREESNPLVKDNGFGDRLQSHLRADI